MTEIEVRCPNCGKLLLKVKEPVKWAEMHCTRCKNKWTFCSTGDPKLGVT